MHASALWLAHWSLTSLTHAARLQMCNNAVVQVTNSTPVHMQTSGFLNTAVYYLYFFNTDGSRGPQLFVVHMHTAHHFEALVKSSQNITSSILDTPSSICYKYYRLFLKNMQYTISKYLFVVFVQTALYIKYINIWGVEKCLLMGYTWCCCYQWWCFWQNIFPIPQFNSRIHHFTPLKWGIYI